MIKIGDQKYDPPKPKNWFLAKRGVKNPKSAQNLIKSDWGKIFRVVQAQQIIKVGDEKFYPSPPNQKSIFGQQGGQKTQNQPKTLPSRIELKFSG